MTKLLKAGIEAVSKLPDERQDAAGEVLLALAEASKAAHALTPDQLSDLRIAMAEADAGDFATDSEIEQAWRKFGL